MRPIALQSAVGGMALSVPGMLLAALGYRNPVSGAISKEIIDFLAVLNALRAVLLPKVIHRPLGSPNEREHHETKIQNG
jgi:cation transport ATPase